MAQKPEPASETKEERERREEFERVLGGLLQVDPEELEEADNPKDEER